MKFKKGDKVRIKSDVISLDVFDKDVFYKINNVLPEEEGYHYELMSRGITDQFMEDQLEPVTTPEPSKVTGNSITINGLSPDIETKVSISPIHLLSEAFKACGLPVEHYNDSDEIDEWIDVIISKKDGIKKSLTFTFINDKLVDVEAGEEEYKIVEEPGDWTSLFKAVLSDSKEESTPTKKV